MTIVADLAIPVTVPSVERPDIFRTLSGEYSGSSLSIGGDALMVPLAANDHQANADRVRVRLRLEPQVLERLLSFGDDWQEKVNDLLREALDRDLNELPSTSTDS